MNLETRTQHSTDASRTYQPRGFMRSEFLAAIAARQGRPVVTLHAVGSPTTRPYPVKCRHPQQHAKRQC